MDIKDSNCKELFRNDFPESLQKSIHCPESLFIKGILPSKDRIGIALVGTRRPSASAPLLCDLLVKSLRGTNAIVVSGLAQGIDSLCHEAAIKYNIPTIAVLAQGLDTPIGGSREKLAHKILEHGGALISSFANGVPALKWQFPLRNGIITGLSKTTVIIESKIKGGALITADLCLKENKTLLAIPGDFNRETAAGTNALLRSGLAKPLFAPEDLGLYCGLSQKNNLSKESLFKSEILLSEEAMTIIEKVGGYTYTIEEVQDFFPFKRPLLLSILTELEIAGLVYTNDGYRYHFSLMEFSSC